MTALDELEADDLKLVPLPPRPRPPAPAPNGSPDAVASPDAAAIEPTAVDSLSYPDPLAEAVARAAHAQPCRHCHAFPVVDRRRGRVRTLHARWCPAGRRAARLAINRIGTR